MGLYCLIEPVGYLDIYFGNGCCGHNVGSGISVPRDYGGAISQGNAPECTDVAGNNRDRDRNIARQSTDDNPAFFVGGDCCDGNDGEDGEEDFHNS